jgi:aspartyl-tRNA(Asn)/glutamyl-tRNA(Gln) amidotransferase subunit A
VTRDLKRGSEGAESGGSNGVTRRTVLGGSAALGTSALLAGTINQTASSNLEAASPAALPMSIGEAGARFRRRELTSQKLTEAYFSHIERFEPKLNAFRLQLKEHALKTAAERDSELRQGKDRGPLHGIPLLTKDMFEMAGTVTTFGSKAYVSRQSSGDATVIRKLLDAGAVFLGKTNMNEFAAGISGTNAYFGDSHNPWNLDHTPGGSTSGSGSALAAGIGLGSTAGDTGGSIRVPASWCGLAGIRTTFGLVSLAGTLPRARSFDVAGPLARNVKDLALLLDAMASYDPAYADSSLAQQRDGYSKTLDVGVKGLKIGIVRNYTYHPDVDKPIADAIKSAAKKFESLGAQVIEIDVPILTAKLDFNKLFPQFLLYEFYQVYGAQYKSTPNAAEEFGPIVQNNIEVGSKVSQGDYERLVKERPQAIAAFKDAFMRVDALLTPALPMVAPLLSASAQDLGRGRMFTIPFSYLAAPSTVIPCGFGPEGLPIGMQLVGNHFQEPLLLRMAYAFEQATDYHKKHPPIFCSSLET